MTNVDFIGDIHGFSDKLEELLSAMGYQKIDGVYQHPTRKAFFVGDFIDRGPKIRETLQLVKAMWDNGHALSVMGNHEYNALCFHTKNDNGEFLRPHTEKNFRQHKATLEQFEGYEVEWKSYIDWFFQLPLYYEQNDFRVVHACWDKSSIDYLKKNLENNRLNKDLLIQSSQPNNDLFQAVDITLKGKEISLPEGMSFQDKDGNLRQEIRIKWWQNALETTFKDYSIIELDDLPNNNKGIHQTDFYGPNERPVFFGHYWLNGDANLYRNNICCLDYSVAKGGHLVAYRFSGEKLLSNDNFVHV